MDLSKLFLDFLEYLELERNVSKLTIRNYKHYLERFLAFLGSPPSGAVALAKAATPASITPEKYASIGCFYRVIPIRPG